MKLWFPIDALLVSQLAHDGTGSSYGLQKHLKHHPAIKSYGITSSLEMAWDYIRNGKTNTIFIAPCIGGEIWEEVEQFISEVRKEHPDIAFVLYASEDCKKKMIERNSKFEHYYFLEEVTGSPLDDEGLLPREKKLNDVITLCDRDWHRTRFNYEIGVSYAGEDRKITEEIISEIKRLPENRVFFDKDEEPDLLGKDLYNTLAEVYSKRCRHAVVMVSKNYLNKVWTKHERRTLQERALNQEEYIIPVTIDDTKIPGMFITTTGYLNIEKGIEKIVDVINENLWVDGTQQKKFIDKSLF